MRANARFIASLCDFRLASLNFNPLVWPPLACDRLAASLIRRRDSTLNTRPLFGPGNPFRSSRDLSSWQLAHSHWMLHGSSQPPLHFGTT